MTSTATAGDTTLFLPVAAAAASVSDVLIESANREAIERLGRVFPADASPRFIFECHLEDTRRVDFAFWVVASSRGPHILGNLDHRIGSDGAPYPFWPRLAEFCRQWAVPESPLRTCIWDIWLEFDFDPDAAGFAAVPSVFLHLRDISGSRADEYRWVLENALPLLSGTPVDAATLGKLTECFDALQGSGRVAYVGRMLAREVEGVRLALRLPSDAVAPYLRRLGWSDRHREVATSVSKLTRSLDIGMLQLDVTETIGPGIGLESAIPGSLDPSATLPRVRSTVDRLLALGLCSERQGEAMTSWPGLTPYILDGMAWPITAQTSPMPAIAWRLALRRVSHVKLTLASGEPVRAKVYLVADI